MTKIKEWMRREIMENQVVIIQRKWRKVLFRKKLKYIIACVIKI